MKRNFYSFRLHIAGLILLIGGCLAWASAAGTSNSLWAAAEELAGNYGGTEVKLGDANGDGTVDVVDVTTIVDFILEKSTPTDAQKANSDVNGDGTIDVVDLTATVQIILGTYKPAESTPAAMAPAK